MRVSAATADGKGRVSEGGEASATDTNAHADPIDEDGVDDFELPPIPFRAKAKSLSILAAAVVAAAGVGCALGVGIYRVLG